MTSVTPEQLQEALSLANFTERRDALRKLAMPALEIIGPPEIATAFAASPLIGDAANQIAPRATRSGLRDSLTEPTLIVLAAWVTKDKGERLYDAFKRAGTGSTAARVCDAIAYPSDYGVPDTRSRTGFEFGRHRTFTDTLINDIKEAIGMTVTKTAEFDTSGMSAAHLISIHDAVMGRLVRADLPADSDDVLGQMERMASEPARIAGIRAMVTTRGAIDYAAADINGGANGSAHPNSPVGLFIAAVTARLTEDMAVEADDEPEAPPPVVAPTVDAAVKPILDAMLATAKLPGIDELLAHITKTASLEAKVAELAARPAIIAAPTSEAASGDLPTGRIVMRPAWEAMGLKSAGAKRTLAFEVPSWQWDATHPHVPAIDTDYSFRPAHLVALLWSLVADKRAWLSGHTGTGKSTLVEQVCARLNWPLIRVNFDSDITRMDLVGRDTLTTDAGGKTISRFVDGILPRAMQGPNWLLLDEIDFVRPDVSYVLQRALEGQGMLITEDGGRLVRPHPWFRISATGNTKGQGDEFGIYAGARPQSLAFINRFNAFIDVEYLPSAEERKLVAARVSALPSDMLDRLMSYVAEHRKAFTNGEVLLPLSPRNVVAAAEALVFAATTFAKPTDAIRWALDTTLLNAATTQDRAVLKGLADRTFA
jgi:cobaltochelatase CobS subunit